jgi:3-oxoacyl-[acyl-carrier protein] reductase
MLLRDKVAIVYGGGGAIGGAVARAFAREGAMLHLAGRSLARLDRVVQDITAAGGNATAQSVDASDEVAVEKHAAAVTASAGAIDVLFNAIGMDDVQGSELVDMPFDDFFKPIRKAAATQYATVRAAGRHMAKRGSGVIMTVTAGPPEAVPRIGGFGPACQMIEGLWRGLAAELSPHGVRVICLRSAGSPDSPDFQEMVRQHTEATGMPGEAFVAEIARNQLLRRLPSLAEIGEMAAMMASDRASALTGTFIHVTGGDRGG